MIELTKYSTEVLKDLSNNKLTATKTSYTQHLTGDGVSFKLTFTYRVLLQEHDFAVFVDEIKKRLQESGPKIIPYCLHVDKRKLINQEDGARIFKEEYYLSMLRLHEDPDLLPLIKKEMYNTCVHRERLFEGEKFKTTPFDLDLKIKLLDILKAHIDLVDSYLEEHKDAAQ